MSKRRPPLVLLFCLLLATAFLLAVFLPVVYAMERVPLRQTGASGPVSLQREPRLQWSAMKWFMLAEPAALQTDMTTTLHVAIHSAPLVVRDSNELDAGPRVFVVHAVVTNTGPVAATDLLVRLDYQTDPANGWVLVPGENPERTQDSLAPGESRHSYWLAGYPAGLDLSHQYEVTASAENAQAVSTTDNVFGNPEPGQTVETTSFLDTGSNGQVSLSSDTIVGVAFTMTVDYDLSNNPERLIFSPAGNLDFDPAKLQLFDVSVRFHNLANTQETTVDNQLYFSTTPLLPDTSTPRYGEVTYKFLTLRSGTNMLCPYAGILYSSTEKYDNGYCQDQRRVLITGTLTFEFSKQASNLQVQEGQRLTYTLHYTNTGTLPLVRAWIWDEVDPLAGTILTSTISPAPDPAETTQNVVAWYLGSVPPSGQPGSSGTVTFTMAVGAPAGDLADGQAIVNNGFFGINEGSLPPSAAVTSTVTSTVAAPSIVVTKTDGRAIVEDGEPLTYTITVRNEGSQSALDLSASDVLPDEVLLAGTPSPPNTGQTGQTLSWDTLGDLAPGEGLTVTVPVSVAAGTASYTTLLNTFLLDYQNAARHAYQTAQVTDTTTVVRPAAFVEGVVFEDTDADGVQDPGEAGLSGVELSLPGAFTPTVSTDATGFYAFRVEADGLYQIAETDPAGYVSTTPNQVTVDVAVGETYVVNFGDVPTGGDQSAIYGTVFADEDGDGEWGADEAGIPGVTVALDGTLTTTTDAYGRYNFGPVASGLHMVEETDPSGYVSTTPNQVILEVAAGETYAVNFGDVLAGGDSSSIYGTVFSDEDGNGVWDGAEAGIAGVTLTLDGTMTTTTDAYGSYTFGPVTSGLHTVEETDPSGYLSTTPNQVAVDAIVGETYQVDFGDMPEGNASSAIYGTVFADEDGDAVWDAGEPGIAGVDVTLDGTLTTTTDANGSYSFGAVAPGLHRVEETDPPDYISTTPNEVAVEVVAGETYLVNYGDMPEGNTPSAIYGTVFADEDGDAEWDDDEPGMAGVTLTLDGALTMTTGAYGGYSFGAVAPGLHNLVETDPPGFISTTPNRVGFNVVAGETHLVNFGDMPAGGESSSIYGTVFNDEDGDGVWDGDESGIAGAAVSLDGVLTTTTDVHGSYSFAAVAPGLHNVAETDPPGYISTTPNDVEVTTEAGNDYTVNFGDVLLNDESCSPDGYEDDDTSEEATLLGEDVIANHDFCDEDSADWHTFMVQSGDVYTITTASLGLRADTILTLFDTDGATLLAQNDDYAGTTNFSSQIVWTAPASGTYYLRITNRAGLSEWLTGYDVWYERQENHTIWLPLIEVVDTPEPSNSRLQQSPAGISGKPATGNEPAPQDNPQAPGAPDGPDAVIDHCNPDAYEVDDTWEQAQPILSGVSQMHTFDSNTDLFAADKDFVVLEIGPQGEFTASSTSTTTSTLLELYDASGLALNRFGVDQLAWQNAPAGRYYLGVTPLSAAYSCDGSVNYDLSVDYTPLYRVLLPMVVTP